MNDLLIETQLRGNDLKFHTTWGIFSPKQIDEGSRLLIEAIKLQGDEDILDIGCGYGPIGISLAKATSGNVHMVDKDFVAIDYAQQNTQLNETQNAKAYLSNVFSHVPETQKFDLIVSNLPAKVGKELLTHLFEEAHTRLNPGGQVVVVCIAGLKDFVKRHFKEIFGNYKKLDHNKAYSVLMAKK